MANGTMLWKPGRIGSVQTRNRIVMAPMGSSFAGSNGEVTEQMIAYYEERARGGVGLIIVENSPVEYPRGSHAPTQPRIDSDAFLPGLSRLADALHAHGAAAALQLNHAGACTSTTATHGEMPVGPSALPLPKSVLVPHPLSESEASALVECFAVAARRAQRAGFDLVEVHGAHLFLVAQFLSPLTNKRVDDYGGSLERRAKFALDIVRAIKAQCGSSFGVSFRISGDEFAEGGRTPAETAETAALLEGAGVDAVHVCAGMSNSPAAIEPASYDQGWRAYLAAEVRRAVTVPVITVGVIRYPEVAEKILQEGMADFVALGRGLIADPHWPLKAMVGDSSSIRPCISCNEGCLQRRRSGGGTLGCTVNPEAGRESRRRATLNGSSPTPRVTVVGGGPAGMQAAISAARMGCEVHLLERDPQLGGQLVAASASPHKSKVGWYLQYLRREVVRSGVKVQLGREVSPDQLSTLAGDVVVVAVGSAAVIPPIKGVQARHVVTAKELLSERRQYPGCRAVVLGGGSVGCEAALFLAQAGERVVVVEQLPELLRGVELLTRDDVLRLMREAGVQGLTGARVLEIGAGDVSLDQGGVLSSLTAEVVVLAVGAVARGDAWRECDPAGRILTVIGDACRPRSILEAVREGSAAAELATLGLAGGSNRN